MMAKHHRVGLCGLAAAPFLFAAVHPVVGWVCFAVGFLYAVIPDEEEEERTRRLYG